jgi:2-polyprenyl-3-methyl-5-hydroxy-6-metoxy-1,4-benzoquinol methylase
MVSNTNPIPGEPTRDKRIAAAKASAGTSADPIYRAVLSTLSALELSGTVLDFGAGAGHLTETLCRMEQFSTVIAADLISFSSDLTHRKLQWVFSDLNGPVPLGEAVCDVIVAVEVIEHLENPRFVAAEWFRLLKPGGIVLLTTPNNESWRSILSLVFRGHFIAFVGQGYPAHITALLRTDLERIMAEAGFERVEFLFTDWGCIPRFTRSTWQQISHGKLKGLRYSDNVICCARKPTIDSRTVPGELGRARHCSVQGAPGANIRSA